MIPHVVALASDLDVAIATKATEALAAVASKEPSFLYQRGAAGAVLAYKLQATLRRSAATPGATPPASPTAALEPVYALLRRSPAARLQFLSRLVKPFEQLAVRAAAPVLQRHRPSEEVRSAPGPRSL